MSRAPATWNLAWDEEAAAVGNDDTGWVDCSAFDELEVHARKVGGAGTLTVVVEIRAGSDARSAVTQVASEAITGSEVVMVRRDTEGLGMSFRITRTVAVDTSDHRIEWVAR